ncbi:MAG: type II secretion system GspH family protein [bacterium]|nr:type II secretion system GspH family protein [bacterium]
MKGEPNGTPPPLLTPPRTLAMLPAPSTSGPTPAPRPRPRRHRGVRRAGGSSGFTLIETMFAVLIIGLGVVVILRSMMHFLYSNMWSTHSATATYLAQEIRELSRSLPNHDRFAGGIYFTDPADPGTLEGWGLEGDDPQIADINDIDDLDGLVFGNTTAFPEGFVMSQRFPGPINSFGEVISEVRFDGTTEMIEVDGDMVPVSMRGWSQLITVEKVDPFDYSVVLDNAANDTEAGGRDVGEYPLRVTVTVIYDGVWEDHAPPLSVISWVVPPR